MDVLQLASAILFFYVFGIAAVLMTWYIVRIIKQFFQEGQEQRSKAKKPPPDIEEEPIKLHVSGGLLEVKRLSDDEQEEP